MSEDDKSPWSDPRPDVFEACAVLHLQVRHVIKLKPADPKNASQASQVECLQAIYISLEQGPGFRTVQEYGGDTRLVEAKLGDEAEISLSPRSTEPIHDRRRERYTARYLTILHSQIVPSTPGW